MTVIDESVVLRLLRDVFVILNNSDCFEERLKSAVDTIKDELGFSAVGLRLKKGLDYPYIYSSGFDNDFIISENSLTMRDDYKDICRDESGDISLECTCGLVISGRLDLTQPYATPFGSLWTNNSADLLKIPQEDDPRVNSRNRCIHDGYDSIALIPVKVDEKIVGLFQLNDKRKNRFTLESVQRLEELCGLIGSILKKQQNELELRLRVNELTCIYDISNVITEYSPDIDRVLSVIVNILPASWRFPKNAIARIEYNQKKYQSECAVNISSNEYSANLLYKQKIDLNVSDVMVGSLVMEYVGVDDLSEDKVFLNEEWRLLAEVARKIENFIEIVLRDEEIELENNELKAIYESTPGVIILVDEDCKIVKANTTAVELSKESFADIKGKLIGEALCCFYSKEDFRGCGYGTNCCECVIRKTINEVLLHGEVVKQREASFTYASEHGSINFDLFVSIYPLKIENKKHVLVCLEDVTALHRNEKIARDNEKSFRNLVSALPDFVVRENLNYRFEYVSPNICKYLDIPLDVYKGKTREELGFSAKICKLSNEVTGRVVKFKKQQEAEYEFNTKLGKRIFNWRATPEFDEDGKLVSIISIFRDITDTVKVHEELEEMSALLYAAMDNSPAGIAIIDVPSGKIRYINQAGIDIYGNSLEKFFNSVYAKDYLDDLKLYDLEGKLVKFDDIPGIKAVKYGESSSKEMILKWEDGKERIIFSTASPIYNKNKEVIAAVIVFPDITERNQLNEQLRQSEKMSAIGQLAGGIAHDFNNQLTGILGYADLIVNTYSDPRLVEYAESIIKAATHSADLTQQLLAFSRKGLFFLQPVDIHDSIIEVIKILRHSIDKRIEIEYDFSAQYSIINGDSSQLENAIINLAINARDAIKNNGFIKFETQNISLDKEYCSSLKYRIKPGEYLQIKISDNGIGIAADIQQKVFEPFFTTKEEGQGIGMGLAAVYGIVDYHNGAIEIDSCVGEGTVVSLYFPTIKDVAKPSYQVKEKTSSGIILLVDDEDIARKICEEMLVQLGYEVVSLTNGDDAVEYFRENFANIDLVILDMIMPVKNGYDAFLEMQQIDHGVRAVISSGYSSDADIKVALDAGALDVLSKPFHLSELSATVKKYIKSSQ